MFLNRFGRFILLALAKSTPHDQEDAKSDDDTQRVEDYIIYIHGVVKGAQDKFDSQLNPLEGEAGKKCPKNQFQQLWSIKVAKAKPKGDGQYRI